MTVNIEPSVAHKPDQRHAVGVCELDGQARWCTDGGHYWDACHQGLLHQFKARPAADKQYSLRQRQSAVQKIASDDLVECVVPSDIFADNIEHSVSRKERRRMQPTGLVKHRLRFT